jgi:hypothetical protein
LSRAVQTRSAESVPVAYTIAYILKSPRLQVSRAPEGILFREVPDPFTNEVDRCGPRVSGWHCQRTVRRGGRGILDSWLRNR